MLDSSDGILFSVLSCPASVICNSIDITDEFRLWICRKYGCFLRHPPIWWMPHLVHFTLFKRLNQKVAVAFFVRMCYPPYKNPLLLEDV